MFSYTDYSDFLHRRVHGREEQLVVDAASPVAVNNVPVPIGTNNCTLFDVPFNTSSIPSLERTQARHIIVPRSLYGSRSSAEVQEPSRNESPVEVSKRIRRVLDEAYDLAMNEPKAAKRLKSAKFDNVNSVQDLMSMHALTNDGQSVPIAKYFLTLHAMLKLSS